MKKRIEIYQYEVILLTIISLSLFLPYLSLVFPKEPLLIVGPYILMLKYQNAWDIFINILFLKFSYLTLFYIWYITATHWWRHFLLPVIGLLVLQFWGMLEDELYEDYKFLSVKYFQILPLVLVLIWIGVKLREVIAEIQGSQKLTPDDPNSFINHGKQLYDKTNAEITNLEEKRGGQTKEDYLEGLIRISKKIGNRIFLKKDYRNRSHFNRTMEYVLCFLLMLLPFLQYAYLLVPEDLKVFKIGILTIGSFGFLSVRVFVWYLLMKGVIFIGLTLWFFNCKFWWKYSILVPFSLISYQILEIFRPGATQIDEYEIWYALPILIPLLVFMIWLSTKLKYFSATYDLYNTLEKEIHGLTLEITHACKDPKNHLQVEWESLKKQRGNYTPQEYLEKLEELKQKLLR